MQKLDSDENIIPEDIIPEEIREYIDRSNPVDYFLLK